MLFSFPFFYRKREPDGVNNENHSKETELKDTQWNTTSGISLKLKKELSQIRSWSILCAFFFNIVIKQNFYLPSVSFTYLNVENEWK